LQITDNAKQKIDGPCNANIASHLFLGKLLLLLLLRQLLQLAGNASLNAPSVAAIAAGRTLNRRQSITRSRPLPQLDVADWSAAARRHARPPAERHRAKCDVGPHRQSLHSAAMSAKSPSVRRR